MEDNQQQKSKTSPTILQTKPVTSAYGNSAATSTSKSSTSSAASTMSTPTVSRAASPAGSPVKRAGTLSTSAAKKSKTSLSEDDEDISVVITESELIGYLRLGPLSTKDLITKFKRQLRADAKNKDIFRELVKKVAMVRPSGNGEDDKLLELRPEFKN